MRAVHCSSDGLTPMALLRRIANESVPCVIAHPEEVQLARDLALAGHIQISELTPRASAPFGTKLGAVMVLNITNIGRTMLRAFR